MTFQNIVDIIVKRDRPVTSEKRLLEDFIY